jgi:hypothetical protein
MSLPKMPRGRAFAWPPPLGGEAEGAAAATVRLPRRIVRWTGRAQLLPPGGHGVVVAVILVADSLSIPLRAGG